MLTFEPVPVPAPFASVADVQLVDGGRDLSGAPGLVEAQGADEVGHARALDHVDEAVPGRHAVGVADEHLGRRLGLCEVRDVGVDRHAARVVRLREDHAAAEDRIFGRDRRGQAVAERGRVGEQVGRGDVGAERGAGELEVVGVEVEERRGATGGHAGELDERLVNVHELLGAAELIDAEAWEGLADTLLGAGGADAGVARARAGIEADEGAQRAVGGLGAGIEVDAQTALVARRVAVAALTRVAGHVAALEPGAAGETQAGVGAGNVEEAGAVGAADADVLDRDRLLDRQVGGMSSTHRRERSSRPEQ